MNNSAFCNEVENFSHFVSSQKPLVKFMIKISSFIPAEKSFELRD